MESNSIYRFWKPIKIQAYIHGEWVNTLNTLLSTKSEKKERRYKEINSPERINKLKNDFGIK